MDLRPYQRECLATIRDRYAAGTRRQLVCLPTGTGKTVVFARFPAYFRMRKRLLILAHREELLEQARDKVLRADPTLSVGIEQGARAASPGDQVVIASVPTLGRKGNERLLGLDPSTFSIVVVDEAHHAVAESYRRVLTHFGVFEPSSQKLLVGFTATPKRGGGEGLDQVFEDIVYARALPEMIAAGYLTPLAGHRVETDVSLADVKIRHGDFVTKQLSAVVNTAPRNELVVTVHRRLLAGRPTLCFCVDVDHAQRLAEAFVAAGVRAAPVSGDMGSEARAETLARFRRGELEVLTNCMVLTEGYDEPSVAGIILARPTRSTLLYTQMIGRGTRLHPGKSEVTVVDVVDATREHTLATLPTLFGLPPRFDLEGTTTTRAAEALAWAEEHRPWVRVDQAVSVSDLRARCRRVDLLDLETPRDVAEATRLAWMARGEDAYSLFLGPESTVLVTKNILGRWEVTHRLRGEEHHVALERSRDRALAKAEVFVEHALPDVLPLVNRFAQWRAEPATEKQLAVLAARKLTLPREGLTKGQASRLLGILISR